jgi:hypothetical protein
MYDFPNLGALLSQGARKESFAGFMTQIDVAYRPDFTDRTGF